MLGPVRVKYDGQRAAEESRGSCARPVVEGSGEREVDPGGGGSMGEGHACQGTGCGPRVMCEGGYDVGGGTRKTGGGGRRLSVPQAGERVGLSLVRR